MGIGVLGSFTLGCGVVFGVTTGTFKCVGRVDLSFGLLGGPILGCSTVVSVVDGTTGCSVGVSMIGGTGYRVCVGELDGTLGCNVVGDAFVGWDNSQSRMSDAWSCVF